MAHGTLRALHSLSHLGLVREHPSIHVLRAGAFARGWKPRMLCFPTMFPTLVFVFTVMNIHEGGRGLSICTFEFVQIKLLYANI